MPQLLGLDSGQLTRPIFFLYSSKSPSHNTVNSRTLSVSANSIPQIDQKHVAKSLIGLRHSGDAGRRGFQILSRRMPHAHSDVDSRGKYVFALHSALCICRSELLIATFCQSPPKIRVIRVIHDSDKQPTTLNPQPSHHLCSQHLLKSLTFYVLL